MKSTEQIKSMKLPLQVALKPITIYLAHFFFAKLLDRKIATPNAHPTSVVNLLLSYSIKQHASDIYLEPSQDFFKILFRVNGSLKQISTISKDKGERLLKYLAQETTNKKNGKYHVKEGTLYLLSQGEKHSFTIFFVPRLPTRSATIKNNSLYNKVPTHPTPTANINKKIFIWQMGKVGSLSVYNSLQQHTKPTTWQPASIAQNKQWPIHNNLIQTHSNQILYDLLHHSNEEFIIISLVRDLLARNISSIFQSMNFPESWRNEYFIANVNDFKKMPFQDQKRELTKQLYKLNTSDKTTTWYDNLLKSHFYYPDVDKYAIDIYAKPFDQKNGLQIYESKVPRVKMIIMRLEDLDNLQSKLGDFLNITNFHLSRGNFASDKWYKEIYKRFKQEYRPTSEEIDALYNSKFMQYFYTPKQIKAFISPYM